MIIIINEKPSVSQQFKKAIKLDCKERKDGYLEGASPFFPGKRVVITWAVGHLVEMLMPDKYDEKYKNWNLADLPFLPEHYRYGVIDNVAKQFATIKRLYHDKELERIYYAGDSGKEGLLIQMLIRQEAGTNPGIDERVVWINSQTDGEIIRGIRSAKPLADYNLKKSAAYMRAMEDYAMGINFTRAFTAKYGSEFNARISAVKRKPVSVGRVMTFVLGMIVKREREIRNFVSTEYYRLFANVGFEASWKAVETSPYYNSPFLYDETGFKDRQHAEFLLSTLNQSMELCVKSCEVKEEKRYAPLLFNLAELQHFCSKKYKLSPEKTLEIAQTLYEAKLTTYPRTDARVLSSSVADEVKQYLEGLSKIGHKKELVDQILANGWYAGLKNTKYVDDAKITDHYAIIPTGHGQDAIGSLKPMELAVYKDVVERFISIFFSPAIYVKASVDLLHNAMEDFFATEKTLKDPGWLVCIGSDEKIEENSLAKVGNGEILPAIFEIREAHTAPPKRYGSGDLILAMENAGKGILDEELRGQMASIGIGTSATRADTIKKLCDLEYVQMDQKTQILTPGLAGECCYDIVNSIEPRLFEPDFTANWENGLNQIEDGSVDVGTYRDAIEKYVTETVEKIKAGEEAKFESREYANRVKCPVCTRGFVVESAKAFGCSEYRNGCNFTIWKNVGGRQLQLKDAEAMILGKMLPIHKYKTKDGKEFEAHLAYRDGKVDYVGVKCPLCEGHVISGTKSWGCSNYKPQNGGCRFGIWKEISGAQVTLSDIEKMTTGGESAQKEFKNKDGKSFAARLVYDPETNKTSFSFEDKLICPVCGKGTVIEGAKSWGCSNYKEENGGCKFGIWKSISGADLTKSDLAKLISGKETRKMSFVSKDGKTFDARLSYDAKTNKTEFVFDEKVMCPKCADGTVLEGEKSFYCSNYKNGCDFSMWKEISGAILSMDNARRILAGQETTKMKFVSNEGKPFEAKLRMGEDGKIAFVKTAEQMTCPVCGKGKVIKGKYGYFCSRKSEGCSWSVYGTVAGVEVSLLDMRQMLEGKTTETHIFKKQDGTTFEAKLKMNGGVIEFARSNKKSTK